MYRGAARTYAPTTHPASIVTEQGATDHLCHHSVSIRGLVCKERHTYKRLSMVDGLQRRGMILYADLRAERMRSANRMGPFLHRCTRILQSLLAALTSYMLLMPTCDRNALRLGCARMSFWGTHVNTCTQQHTLSTSGPASWPFPHHSLFLRYGHMLQAARATHSGAICWQAPVCCCPVPVLPWQPHQAPPWLSAATAPCWAAPQTPPPCL